MKKLILTVAATTILALSTSVHAQTLTSNVIGGTNPPPSTFGNVKAAPTTNVSSQSSSNSTFGGFGTLMIVLLNVFGTTL